MSLEPGSVLLHYRLVGPLGAGGMGEVWRATDTKLGRDVAIKILPEHFANNVERLARFEREARLLASLNDPRIASIYGIHDADDGTRFLAMELVEGEDLAEQLERGPMAPDEALNIAEQIALALESAHESGVIHRDLKPANVKVTPDGKVKVLDFGLAKGFKPGPVSSSGPTQMSNSPTVTSPETITGMILGTAAYMSPEQARGKLVDRRTDVWAFGCLLYEMLTGRRAFPGETLGDVIAAILTSEPNWEALPSSLPAGVHRLIRRCLARDLADRLRDMGDAALLLREAEAADESAPGVTDGFTRSSHGHERNHRPIAAGVLALTLLAVVGTASVQFYGSLEPPAQRHLVRSMTRLTDLSGWQHSPDISPDGRHVLFVSNHGDGEDQDIFLLRVGGENAVNLTEDSPEWDGFPAFSPDGQRIAFASRRDGGGIFVMGATGESPQRVTRHGAAPAWSPDGTRLVYTTESVLSPYGRTSTASLWVVDLDLRDPVKIYDGDAVNPAWSPDGSRIAFWHAEAGQRDILTIPSQGGDAVPVTDDAHADWDPFWSPNGRWIYFVSDRGGSPDLWRIAVNPSTGRPRGDPQPITMGVSRVMNADLSSDGRRIAVMAGRESAWISLADFDPASESLISEPKRIYSSAESLSEAVVSPDGTQVAYRTASPREEIWTMRVDGSDRRRLLSDEHRNRGLMYTADGAWLVFYSNRSGKCEAWALRSDGSSRKQLTDTPGMDIVNICISPGQKWIAAWCATPDRFCVIELPDGGLAAVEDFVRVRIHDELDDIAPRAFSPDGRFLAAMRVGGSPGVLSWPDMTWRPLELQSEKLRVFTRRGGGWLTDPLRYLLKDGRSDKVYAGDLERATVAAVPARVITEVLPTKHFSVSPDGRYFAFVNERDEYDIWLLELEP